MSNPKLKLCYLKNITTFMKLTNLSCRTANEVVSGGYADAFNKIVYCHEYLMLRLSQFLELMSSTNIEERGNAIGSR